MILQRLLIEEDPSGWRMLVGCILLNLTRRSQVDGVYPHLFNDYPTAESMAEGNILHLEHHLRPLGLCHRRAVTLHRFGHWWEIGGGSAGRVLLGQWVDRDPTFGERIRAMEPPGIGEYGRDSWVIFAEGLVPDWPVHDRALLEWLTERDPAMRGPAGLTRRPWEPRDHYAARTAGRLQAD